jgi:2-hydroxy-6-oxonona-2,4-dienedioate hydrolase
MIRRWATRFGEVNFEVRGALAQERPVMLLVHGGHGSWRHWIANLDDLALDFDLLVPDLPGYGESCDLPPEAGLAEQAEALDQATRAALGGRLPTIVVGFSFGTIVGTALLERWQKAGQQPHALVLVNPPLGREVSEEVLAIQARAADLARQQGLQAAIECTLRQIMLSDPARVTPELIELGVQQVEKARFKSRPISRSVDLRERLAALHAPRFVVLGERDPHQRAALATRLPQYQSMFGENNVVVLPGAHWLQYDCPEAFATTLRGIAATLSEAQGSSGNQSIGESVQ